MKIVVLANYDVGLYQFRKELIEKLLEGNEVVIALPYGDLVEPLKDLGCKFIDIQVDRRGINPIKDLKLCFSYLKMLRKQKPDLVITYTIKPNVYGGLACRLLKVPYVVNVTGLGTAFEGKKMLRKIAVMMNKIGCKSANVIFFENEENKKIFIEEGITVEKKAYRLNGAGVNLEKYQVSDYPNSDTIRFLFMGRVMAEKGIDELFIAMKKLIKDGIKCELDVLGKYEENYKDKIKKYEAEGWLHYHGFQKDVRPYIDRCHCFVLPSWHEGMANTNLESAASGRPIITSNIHGCLEAVIDGKTGYLVQHKNPDNLYKMMKQFASLSYEEQKAMGLAGRKHMEEMFDKKQIVEETINCLYGGQL